MLQEEVRKVGKSGSPKVEKEEVPAITGVYWMQFFLSDFPTFRTSGLKLLQINHLRYQKEILIMFRRVQQSFFVRNFLFYNILTQYVYFVG